MSQTQRKLELNGRTITLVGTAHVSKESIEEVENTIREIKPDCVGIELDEKRAESIQNPDKYSNLDIVQVLKKKQGFLLLANLILASFQRRMGLNVGVKPGDEMLAAMKVAEELNIPAAMVDRPIQITLRRAWAKNSLWGKCKLLAALLTSAFEKEEVDEQTGRDFANSINAIFYSTSAKNTNGINELFEAIANKYCDDSWTAGKDAEEEAKKMKEMRKETVKISKDSPKSKEDDKKGCC